MKVQFSNINICGIATALPEQVFDLETLRDKLSENELKRIIFNTGIVSVHVAREGQRASDLCVAAASRLFKELGVDPMSIGAIVFVSQTPDYVAPATSAVLQERLGLSQDSVAFDINYGCSGYIYGLYQAALLINSGSCERVLVCAGDVITPLLHKSDHQLRMVLGDAGSATLVEKKSVNEKISVVLKTDGSGKEHLIAAKSYPNKVMDKDSLLDGYYHMNGASVMEFALREVPGIVDALLDFTHWDRAQVGTYALHQANKFILDYLRKKCKLPIDAVPIAVKTTGNTGPASIPLLLSMFGRSLKQEGRLAKVILCGFGVGLSWGGLALTLTETAIYEPLKV